MVMKNFLLFRSFFVLILFVSNVSAFSCTLTQTCTTPNPGEGVLIAISGQTNAHGELRDGGGNYPWKICCDFEGTDKCTGSNGVLSLSDTTNAHAEILNSGTYKSNVCFGDLQCRSGSNINCAGDEFNVVSFSDTTNAHLGGFDDYPQKVCCKWTVNAYWADPDDLNVQKTVVGIGDRVALVLNNSGLDAGTGVYNDFQIFEHDGTLNPDDTILPRDGGQVINGDVTTSSNKKTVLVGIWEITQADYNEGKDSLLGISIESEPDEFYFIANGVNSSYLKIVARDEGVSFCDEFTEEDTCSSCSNSVDCSAAYNSANDISKETFSVGCGEAILDDPNYVTNCFCQWNSDEGACSGGVSYVSANSKTIPPHCKNDAQDEGEEGVDCGGTECGVCVNGTAVAHCKDNSQDEGEEGVDCGGTECGACSYTISFPKIGSCNYLSQGDDDCSDGFLTYTWTGQWSWGFNNGFATTENEFSNDLTDYIYFDGLYYYDPLRMSTNCQGGSNVIQCPAEVQLPFFGFFGFVSSLILISMIYLYLIFKNNKNLY
jgi:hypothetical protein